MNLEALMLEGSSEILMLLDVQSLQIVAANDAAHQQLGYEQPQLVGRVIGDIECALSDLFFWEEVAASTTLMEAQGSYQRRDGSVFEIRKFVQRAGDNQEFYQLRARPARKQRVEPEVDVTGLHLTATLEATDDGILLTDNDGTILNMNHRFSNLMALPEHLLAERDDHGIVAYIESILLKSPGISDTPTALSQAIDLKLDLGGDTFEKLHLADGRVVECMSHPARDRHRTIGRVFCYRDITERVQHEEYLQEARDIAEQATISKGQFLANMSHEIRTPMNAILGMLKLMHATELNERQFDYVNKAEGAAQSLLGLLNDILDFSKIEAGKLELDPQAFSPERIFRELSVIMALNLGNKPVELLFDIDPTIPKTLLGDAMRLQQILINLAGNALKFTQSGEVVVHMRALEHQGNATRLLIGVRDSGIGIAPENQAKIFSDFSQAEASTTRRYGGTGLGLSICKRLVELMGGKLAVESVLGKGSDFYFEITLPHAEATTHSTHSAHSELPAPEPETAQESMDVLVVDDNAVARELLQSMMRSLGWKVDAAAGGLEAIDRVQARARHQQSAYQVIFVDWEMPGLDGWETMAELRQLGDAFGKPICIMLTVHNRQALTQRTPHEQASLNAFMVKPVTAAMIREVVSEARAGRSGFRRKDRVASKAGRRLIGMRLLVVEDNLVNQQVARELLVAEGAEVELADNGLAAVSALTQARNVAPFHVILMDVQMPVMDGFTATRVIRKDLGMDKIPIIAMTANAMASDREDCLEAGMTDHIGKPFDLNYLVNMLLQKSDFKPAASPDAPAPATPSGHELPAAPMVKSTLAEDGALAVDLETALSHLDGLTDLYVDLAKQFIEELESVVAEYDRALSASLFAEAARQMHTLKGTAATLGVMPLSLLAHDLEKICKAATQPADALSREPELAAMVSASIAALRAAIEQLEA